MNKAIFLMTFLFTGLLCMTSCETGSIEHISGTRLVMLQPIPVTENRFDENFKDALELLYPHECHDTVFIQDQIFLERIDLKIPFKKEFVIPPSLMRDFFGSNNPDKKQALREELFYISDTAFEKNPDKQFLTASQVSSMDRPEVIGNYLSRNRNNALVYLLSNDTVCKNYEIAGLKREVYHDFGKLNCRIVSDLRKKEKEALMNTSVILIVIPPELNDSAIKPFKPSPDPGHRQAGRKVTGAPCPPDSVVNNNNKRYIAFIKEFRNLLHYIATTRTDEALKSTYQADAYQEIHKIPDVRIEGIPENDLRKFLHSGFSANVTVSAIYDQCRMIGGVRISENPIYGR